MRADVWAFGCLLYETLTGRKTFDGPALSDVIAAVLEREPDWSALPAGTPDNIRRLLRRCLRKDLQSRLRHIGDARIELQETVLTTPVPAAAPKQKLLAWAAGGLLAGILLTAAFAWALWP
jgi:serine/threonine-protein kinase